MSSPWMWRTIWVAGLMAAGLSSGCGDDGGGASGDLSEDSHIPTDDGASDAGGDGSSDAPAESDSVADVAGGDATEPGDGGDGSGVTDGVEVDVEPDATGPWVPPAVAPAAELEPVPIDEWMACVVANPNNDKVAAAIADGTFAYPEQGSSLGTFWSAETPDENGAFFAPFGNVTMYAVTRLSLDAPKRLVVRADGIWDVFTKGRHTCGDIYQSKRHRVALTLDAGEHLLFVRSFRASSPPEVQLWSTPHELYVHDGDITAPALVAGDTQEQWLGVPVLNLAGRPVIDLVVHVAPAPGLDPAEVQYPALAPESVTQIAVPIRPTGALAPGQAALATLRFESPSLEWSYEYTVSMPTADPATEAPLRRTRRSNVDASAQYYGLLRPSASAPAGPKALVLSLHGAGVDAINQAGSYGPKDDAYIVAPTNRRPFGFDWESFGRLDALEALAHAKATLDVDPTRVYVTGHSMGGHGTWQMGTLFPGEFAVVGPSAGWISFYTYGGSPKPQGAFAWSQASSDSLAFVGNLAKRGVYIIHGTADDNVPIGQAETMYAALDGLAEELYFHKEEGGGHWWDGDAAPGADCVDWPPLFELMGQRSLDPAEREFDFATPAPWVSRRYAWVSIDSADRPDGTSSVSAAESDTGVSVSTDNVRALRVDTGPLLAAGVQNLDVDGAPIPVDGEIHVVGPTTGKRPGLEGPGTAIFYRPFCIVYPDSGPGADFYRTHAGWLVSLWNVIGNGHACALPASKATTERLGDRNVLWLGVSQTEVLVPASVALSWSAEEITLGGTAYTDAAAFVIFPVGDALHAAWIATEGSEALIGRVQPFTSRLILPDYLVLQSQGTVKAGFFDAEWGWDPTLSSP